MLESKSIAIDRAKTPAITRTPQITIEDLEKLDLPLEFDGENIVLTKSLNDHWNYKLDTKVKVPLAKVLAAKEIKLVDYIIRSFLTDTPRFIPFIFENQSMIKLNRHLLRDCSGSLRTPTTYVFNIHKYSTWLTHSPDAIIEDLQIIDDEVDKIRAKNHRQFLNDYLADLQDAGLSQSFITSCIRAIHSFYNVNGAKIVRLDKPLKQKITYKDRAPKPEELVKMIDFGDARDALIILMLASGGFREETLSKLKYRHVKDDYEAGRIPLHIHVEAAITKGKYHDYDTFINSEAVQYLQMYLESRRKGTKDLPPEILTDESPLIRNGNRSEVTVAGPEVIYRTVHNIAVQVGVSKKQKASRMFDVRTHSLRKYFRSQLSATSLNDEIIEYMMGHTPDTYEDVQSLGIDKLRELYLSANLTIRPKMKSSKIDQLKEIIRAWGENPEEILTKEALTRSNITIINGEERENRQLSVLAEELKELIKREAKL